jgi:membrane-associated protein
MPRLPTVIDFLLHLDRYILSLINWFGAWTYLILFAVVFVETGLVILPFLPGDSLLFAAGAFAAAGAVAAAGGTFHFNVLLLFLLLALAAFLGDTVNYWIGHAVGPRVFTGRHGRFLKKEHLDKTHAFYEKYGGETIIIARFIPIVRTFAPFVAGIGRMSYARFISYNIVGGVLWVALFVFGGYFFGNLPFVKKNFSLVIFAIILLSVLPGVIEYLRQRRAGKKG